MLELCVKRLVPLQTGESDNRDRSGTADPDPPAEKRCSQEGANNG